MKSVLLKKNISKLLSRTRLLIIFISTVLLLSLGFFINKSVYFSNQVKAADKLKNSLKSQLEQTKKTLTALQNVDQYVRNETLEKEINNIKETYNHAVNSYEKLLKLKENTNKTADFDMLFAQILRSLSEKNYTSASASLLELDNSMQKKQNEIATSFNIPKNVPVNNTPPSSGYQRQMVQTSSGSFITDIVSADLNNTKVQIDTASSGDCSDNCPVSPLADYVARSGAFAGVNGPYFCPASYPSCAGKTNSFDTLLMNKNKTYFNSGNNVYSVVPAVIFNGNSARFVTQSLQWGRDTEVDAVIAAQPLLVLNGEVVFGGDSEVKRLSKGTRAFIGTTDNTVYIGVVHNVNTAELAQTIHSLGIKNALNLDSGGSIAMWADGRYVAGPGRNTPFGIVLVKK